MENNLTAEDMLTALMQRSTQPRRDSNMARLRELIEAKEGASMSLQNHNPELIDNHVNTKFSSGLIDDLTGSKIASRMTHEKMPERNIQDSIVNRLKLIGGTPQDSSGLMMKLIQQKQFNEKNKAINDRKYDSMAASFANKITTDANKLSDNYKEFQNQADNLSARLQSGKVSDLGAIVNGMARFVNGEKGPLAEGDVARTMIRTMEQRIGEFKSVFTGNPDEPIPADLIQALMTQVQDANRYRERRYNSIMDQRRKSALSQVNHGVRGASDLGANTVNALFDDYMIPTSKPSVTEPKAATRKASKQTVKPTTVSLSKEEEDELQRLEAELGGI